MTYIVEYLKPEKKRFYKKNTAEKFIRKQYKTIRFLEKKENNLYSLEIPTLIETRLLRLNKRFLEE